MCVDQWATALKVDTLWQSTIFRKKWVSIIVYVNAIWSLGGNGHLFLGDLVHHGMVRWLSVSVSVALVVPQPPRKKRDLLGQSGRPIFSFD